MDENAVAKEIVDAAFRIHTTLGPGLLESVYNAVLAHELGRRGRARHNSSRSQVHKKQLLTIRLAGKRLGLLINFNVALIKDGITRIVNGLKD